MKKIFVTIAEFVENGGIMIKDGGRRKIFNMSGVEFKIYDEGLYNYILENQSNDYFVQVGCTPIYI